MGEIRLKRFSSRFRRRPTCLVSLNASTFHVRHAFAECIVMRPKGHCVAGQHTKAAAVLLTAIRARGILSLKMLEGNSTVKMRGPQTKACIDGSHGPVGLHYFPFPHLCCGAMLGFKDSPPQTQSYCAEFRGSVQPDQSRETSSRNRWEFRP